MNISSDHRKACTVNTKAINAGLLECKEGVSTLEIDAAIEKYIRENDCIPAFKNYRPLGTPYAFPATACISVNDAMVHGIPNDYRLVNGDIVTVDVGTNCNGWFADSARTIVIGKNPEAEKLAYAAEAVLFAQIEEVKHGVTITDLILASEREAKKLAVNIMSPWCGHGIGQKLHDEPLIPATIDSRLSSLKRKLEEKKYRRVTLIEGQTICLEPVISFGQDNMFLDKDGWTVRQTEKALTAHSERCVLVTSNGFEILS